MCPTARVEQLRTQRTKFPGIFYYELSLKSFFLNVTVLRDIYKIVTQPDRL